MQYKTSSKITPEVIDEIVSIQENEGLTPENLLDQAKNKSSPLYNLFEWDNNRAGNLWRLQQARVLINEVKVVVNDKTMYAFENVSVTVKDSDASQREYMPIDKIYENPTLREQIVNRALGEVSYWREKYATYNELGNIFNEIDKTKKKWQGKKKKE